MNDTIEVMHLVADAERELTSALAEWQGGPTQRIVQALNRLIDARVDVLVRRSVGEKLREAGYGTR